MTYTGFIPQNVAPIGTRRIGIFDCNGNRVGFIPLGYLTPPVPGRKLYSFGAVSDVHVQYDTARDDFQRALAYLNNHEDVAFTCICGDLTANGTAAELTTYKGYVDSYSPDTPVYAVMGNHDAYQGLQSAPEAYIGHPKNYVFTYGDDVFIMMSVESGYPGDIGLSITQASFQWLYEQLESNRNKRCFLFMHILSQDSSGDAWGAYNALGKMKGAEKTVWESLLNHYSNVIWFHGHSHMMFNLQDDTHQNANVSHVYANYDVHIPSLAVPREVNPDGSYEYFYAGSEGYVVDVYPDGIHLRGRDFVKGEFLPIASYWLDTTLKTVEAGSYFDPTATINTDA